MSLEVIEKVTQVETETRERKSAAEAEAKKIIADAEREGLALLQQVRAKAAETGGAQLKQAEARAAERSAKIAADAEAEAAVLRTEAGKHLEEAAEYIVGRVVNHCDGHCKNEKAPGHRHGRPTGGTAPGAAAAGVP